MSKMKNILDRIDSRLDPARGRGRRWGRGEEGEGEGRGRRGRGEKRAWGGEGVIVGGALWYTAIETIQKEPQRRKKWTEHQYTVRITSSSLM